MSLQVDGWIFLCLATEGTLMVNRDDTWRRRLLARARQTASMGSASSKTQSRTSVGRDKRGQEVNASPARICVCVSQSLQLGCIARESRTSAGRVKRPRHEC